MPTLAVPTSIPAKRNFHKELDLVWEDEDGNVVIREFDEEEEVEWDTIDKLVEEAPKHRIGMHLVSCDKSKSMV
jgi:hypothetical protein